MEGSKNPLFEAVASKEDHKKIRVTKTQKRQQWRFQNILEFSGTFWANIYAALPHLSRITHFSIQILGPGPYFSLVLQQKNWCVCY